MFNYLSSRGIAILVVALVLLTGAGTTAAFAAGAGGGADDPVEIASQDVTIRDAVVTIDGAHLTGSGVDDQRVENRTYTVQEATMSVDGLTVVWNDTTYEICHIDITVDDVGLRIHNLRAGNG